jgi:NAD-reducing hydrogenase large subunit
MAVRIPAAAAKLRELLHCAQFVQSHALSFFHLSAPDLLLGIDYDPAKRNVAGLLEEHPNALRDGIALRKFGQQVIERLAKERIHPSWTVPGGVNAPLDPHAHERTLDLQQLPDDVRRPRGPGRIAPALRRQPPLRRPRGPDGGGPGAARGLRGPHRRGGDGRLVPEGPVLQARRLPRGVYRVGPLARLNAADRCGTPEADTTRASSRRPTPSSG